VGRTQNNAIPAANIQKGTDTHAKTRVTNAKGAIAESSTELERRAAVVEVIANSNHPTLVLVL
jgi:hypothetical protein